MFTIFFTGHMTVHFVTLDSLTFSILLVILLQATEHAANLAEDLKKKKPSDQPKEK